MSASFARSAGRLAGLAGRILGWRPADFWHATPAELAAILLDDSEPGATGMGRAELEALMEREQDE